MTKRITPPWLLTVGLLALTLGGPAARGQATSWQWALAPGVGQGTTTVVDAAGNVFVTGSFQDTIAFGATTLVSAGGRDAFVAQLDPSGAPLWAVRAGGPGDDEARSLALAPNGTATVVGTCQDAAVFGATTLSVATSRALFVARLSPTGTWLTAESGDDGGSAAVAVDGTGAAYVAGIYTGTDFTLGSFSLVGNGRGRVFVAKLTAAGVWQWAVSANNDRSDLLLYDVVVDSAGSACITGDYNGTTTNFGPTTLTNQGTQNMYVAKLTPTGQWQWAVGAGGSPYTTGLALAAGERGTTYVSGNFFGPTGTFGPLTVSNTSANPSANGDAYVAKLSAAGQWQWVASTTGAGHERANGLTTDGRGNVYVSGGFRDSAVTFGDTTLANQGEEDIFVARLSGATGAWQWAMSAGGTGSEFSDGVAVDGADRVYLTGSFASPTLLFGPVSLLHVGSPNDPNVYIARADATPLGAAPTVAAGALHLYPNPAREAVTVTAPNHIAATRAELLDLTGRVIRTVELRAGAARLPLTNLAPGLYAVRVAGQTRRLVVE